MGFTKDLVCGVWVGGDDRSIHFRTRMGEGSRSAMPIFGKFMQSVYTDKKLGYSPGPFPKPSMEIKKNYQNCYSSGGETTAVSDSTVQEEDTSSNSRINQRLPQIQKIQRDTVITNRNDR